LLDDPLSFTGIRETRQFHTRNPLEFQ